MIKQIFIYWNFTDYGFDLRKLFSNFRFNPITEIRSTHKPSWLARKTTTARNKTNYTNLDRSTIFVVMNQCATTITLYKKKKTIIFFRILKSSFELTKQIDDLIGLEAQIIL